METLKLALKAREIDIRASPYDLYKYTYKGPTIENNVFINSHLGGHFNPAPIYIETLEVTPNN